MRRGDLSITAGAGGYLAGLIMAEAAIVRAQLSMVLNEIGRRGQVIRAEVRAEIADKFAAMMRERFGVSGDYGLPGSLFDHRAMYTADARGWPWYPGPVVVVSSVDVASGPDRQVWGLLSKAGGLVVPPGGPEGAASA